MNKLIKERPMLKPLITGILLQIVVTALSVIIFAFAMYFLEMENKYSPVLGSIAIALGSFAGSYYLSAKKGNKGYIFGLSDGFATFLIVSIIGLVINKGNITINTLFHLVIFVLSGAIGGIFGVNRKDKKYI